MTVLCNRRLVSRKSNSLSFTVTGPTPQLADLLRMKEDSKTLIRIHFSSISGETLAFTYREAQLRFESGSSDPRVRIGACGAVMRFEALPVGN